jgi:hypothetical protein
MAALAGGPGDRHRLSAERGGDDLLDALAVFRIGGHDRSGEGHEFVAIPLDVEAVHLHVEIHPECRD